MCSAGKVCYIVTQGVYIHTPSLHSVCVTGPLTFLVWYGMKLDPTLFFPIWLHIEYLHFLHYCLMDMI
jgi:hypothetical protein